MNPLGHHPDDESREPATVWTDEDIDAVCAAIAAGDLPAEVTCTDGRRVVVSVDEAVAFTGGKATGMQRLLRDLVLDGRRNDLVYLTDPKDPAVPAERTTVGALAAALLAQPARS
jgi:hypothetical protein